MSSEAKETTALNANDEAWANLHGYKTTSGCPCWDETDHMCIPKHSGFGYNPNFWFCCWWMSPICCCSHNNS
ncbi:MAG: hypothetical protein Q8P67_22220 [archaeon]|nr:hypothetical protein [archaeon]